jgi:hypothetical protein
MHALGEGEEGMMMLHEIRIQENGEVRRITLNGKPFSHVVNGEVVLVWGGIGGAPSIEVSGPLMRHPKQLTCERCEELEDKLDAELAQRALEEERLASLSQDLDIR